MNRRNETKRKNINWVRHAKLSKASYWSFWKKKLTNRWATRGLHSLAFFMELSQLYAATLTHYSTEPLTTGPNYNPLLLLLALAGDVHPNSGPSRYPCSVFFKNVTSQGTSYLCTRCSHWVHSRCSGLRNAADYRKANGWICMTPPQSRAPPPPPTPAHMPTISDKTFNLLQWNANGIGSKQTELSIFLEAHNVKVAAIQESKLTAKSRSPSIQNYTLVRHDRRQGPRGGLLFFYSYSVSFTRKSLSTTSKNDPHLEKLTISIVMDNTELLITNTNTNTFNLEIYTWHGNENKVYDVCSWKPKLWLLPLAFRLPNYDIYIYITSLIETSRLMLIKIK